MRILDLWFLGVGLTCADRSLRHLKIEEERRHIHQLLSEVNGKVHSLEKARQGMVASEDKAIAHVKQVQKEDSEAMFAISEAEKAAMSSLAKDLKETVKIPIL